MTVYYDENGANSDKEPNKLCAKICDSETGPMYWILARSGRLYKKTLPDKEKQKDGWKLHRFNGGLEHFNIYLEYLKTNEEHRYNIANRQFT